MMIPRRTAAAAVFAIGATLMALAMEAHSSAPAAFELPRPTGRYAVGTTGWRVTDGARSETFAGGTATRQVEVLAWYPAAAAKGTPAPYLREGLPEVRSFATLLRGPATIFDALADVPTHATLDAPPIAAPGKLPLLLFSSGYTAVPSSYTALLEDLASHGFVVLHIIHPYEETAATLDGGRVVTLLDDTGAMRQPIRDVLAEWGTEDAIMAKVTQAAGEDEQLTLLRGYLASIPKTHIALRRWVDDTKLVLNRLKAANGALAGRMDLARVGVFGHSMGGVTAGQFCVEDRRCRAGLNLDGIPQSGSMIDATMKRPFLMVYSARPGRAGASDAIYRRAASPYYRVDVRDTLHLEFSDMPFWAAPLRQRGAFGAMTPVRAARITAAIVREYFDQTLNGKPSPLLAGKPVFPEVKVTRP